MLIIHMSDEETRYNNRQIERMLDTQSKELKEHVTLTIRPFLELLSDLDKRTQDLELKRASQNGYNKAMAVSGGVGFTVLMALSGWALYQVANIGRTVHTQLENTVQSAVEQALIPYSK